MVASAAGLPGQVTFPAGLTSVRVPFTINNDEVGLEDLESYLASLSLTPEAIAAGVSLGAISQASVQVVDDDGTWSLYVVANGSKVHDNYTCIIAVTMPIVVIMYVTAFYRDYAKARCKEVKSLHQKVVPCQCQSLQQRFREDCPCLLYCK